MSRLLKWSVLHRPFNKKKIVKFPRVQIRSCSTQNGVIKSSSSDVILTDMSLTEMLFSRMEAYHKFIAIECFATGRQYTFEKITVLSSNFGKALRKKLKLQQGDVVALLLDNSPEFAISTLGVMYGGLVLSTLNPAYTADEISKQLKDSNTKLVITKAALHNKVKQALDLTDDAQIPIIAVKEKQSDSLPLDTINFEELITEKINDFNIDTSRKPSDLAILPYSSGTTGLPKGVQLTHSNLTSNLLQTTHADFNHYIQPSESHQDTFPIILPLFHIYGFCCGFLKQLYNGTKIVTMSKFTPDSFLSMVQRHPITHLYAAPPLVLFMITNSGVKPEFLKQLRFLINGGASLRHSDEIKFLEKFKRDDMIVGQAYGLTETSPIVSFLPVGHTVSSTNGGSAGKLVPNTYMKILAVDGEDTEKILGPNEAGELLIKGPQNTKGYFKRPEENANLYKGDWLRTGDIAYYNEEGYLFITERLKELIKVKGFQVPPAELEALIRSYPSVQDAAVIGIDHSVYGEVPRAYVVPKPGHSLKPEEIKEFVAKKVVQYKHLTGGVKMIDSIPRTSSGKILRRELRKLHLENLV